MKKIGIALLLLLCNCKTTRKSSMPAAPSTLDFSGYTALEATTYCSVSTTPDACPPAAPAQEKFAKDCKEAQRCILGQSCQPGGLMLVTCKDCTFLCSEDPYSALFQLPAEP